MKKYILLVGIFVSSITYSQEEDIPVKDRFDAIGLSEVVYDLLTKDMEMLRDNYDKYITTSDNEFNITDDGMQLGCLRAGVDIETASYDDVYLQFPVLFQKLISFVQFHFLID